jgi:thioredoxin 1
MKKINEQNKELILKDKKVVVKYSAVWCGPCKMYNEVLKNIGDQYEIYTCDVDENPAWTNQLNIRSIPTTILFDNGVEVRRLQGIQQIQTIIKLFE